MHEQTLITSPCSNRYLYIGNTCIRIWTNYIYNRHLVYSYWLPNLDYSFGKMGSFMATKSGPGGPFLAAKISPGNHFWVGSIFARQAPKSRGPHIAWSPISCLHRPRSYDLIGIVEPVRAITVHVHGRFLSDILIQLCDMINK